MSKVKVAGFGVSMDGFSAGPKQDLENPLGIGGGAIFEWFFHTEVFNAMHGNGGGDQGIDNTWAARAMDNVGAWILGRNMFGPVRGPWRDDSWKGWWGEEPPYHVPTFVLTHHARAPIVMKGGTTFYFVTDGIDSALAQAKKAAGNKDVRIGGGVSTVRQYLQTKKIDELHVATRPVLLGEGEALFAGLSWPALGYKVVKTEVGEKAVHVLIQKT